MRLELTERLRCPSTHPPTPLVVVAREKRDRDLREGYAGCPVCRLEARITAGHLQFEGVASAPALAPTGATPELERVIALLGLSEPGGAVLLTGRYAALAESLAALTEAAVVVMHAGTPRASDQVSAVLGALGSVPFTDGTFRGAALDDTTPVAIAADAVRTVALRGRVLAAAALPMPTGLKQLARDDREWVAARELTEAVVALRRGR
jgi:hypothetical protein